MYEIDTCVVGQRGEEQKTAKVPDKESEDKLPTGSDQVSPRRSTRVSIPVHRYIENYLCRDTHHV